MTTGFEKCWKKEEKSTERVRKFINSRYRKNSQVKQKKGGSFVLERRKKQESVPILCHLKELFNKKDSENGLIKPFQNLLIYKWSGIRDSNP